MARNRSFSVAVLAVVAVALAASHAAADRVRVRAWPHDGFLRLVFDWDTAVDYAAEVQDGVLSVRFDRPLDANLEQARKNLGDKVQAMELDESGHGLRVTLTKDFDVRHFVLNGSIVVDLVASELERESELPPVTVRLGEHAGFSRVVFDWPESVGYTVDPAGERVSIRFERRARFDLSAVDGSSPGILAATASAADGGAETVTLAVPDGARITHFRDGPRVALDITHSVKQPAELEVAAAPVQDVVIEAVPGVTSRLEPEPAVGRPIQIAPVPAAPAATETEIAAGSDKPAEVLDEPIIAVRFEPKGTGGVLRFEGRESIPKAVFSRGGWTWVVVEEAGSINVSRLQVEAEGVLSGIEQLPNDSATVLRFKLKAGINPVAVADGDDWLLDIAERPAHPLVELVGDVRSQSGRTQFMFQLDAGAAGRPLTLSDPEIGDSVQVVPITLDGHGVAPTQRFVDLDILESAQGVVLAPRRDQIDVRLAAGGLAIDAQSGAPLRLTTEEERLAYVGNSEDSLPRIFQFDAWQRSYEPDFNVAKQELQWALVSAAEEARDERRMDLARFFFANGMSERSLGVLSNVARGGSAIANSAEFLAMRGASRFLLGDLEGAAQDLNSNVLDDEPELGLWRAALLAEAGDYLSAAVGLQKGHPYASRYPEHLRIRFALLGADIGLRVEEPSAARAWLTTLDDAVAMKTDDASMARVFDGQALLLEGESEAALEIFDQVIGRGDRRSRAAAILARTELMLAREEYTPAQAIDALESLRFVWRGDSFEFSVLRRLGELQIEAGSFQEGLQTLKRATSNFEEHPLVGELTVQMQGVFEGLFLNGRADDLAPVKAIALFNEFRELTPPGASGDQMIRRLADRLAAVDLLDQAAGLLQHQVEFRITDQVEKAEVGARLAALRLLDRQPTAALEALGGTRASTLPDALGYERQIIRARAMAELGQIEEALSLLELTPTEEAKRLRAGVLWDIQDWSRAALALGDIVVVSDRLSESQARDVLRRAIALLLDGQTEALAQVRQELGVAMSSTPFAIDFRIVTSSQGTPADIQSAVRRVAAVDDFKAFMEQYRGRIATDPQPSESLVN